MAKSNFKFTICGKLGVVGYDWKKVERQCSSNSENLIVKSTRFESELVNLPFQPPEW